MVERCILGNVIATNGVRGLAKCMQHLVWSLIWCLIAVAVGPVRYAFVWGSLVEVDGGTDSFSPKHEWHLEVNHHRSCFLGDGLDHAFGHCIPMLSVGKIWCIRCTMSSKHQSEGLVVVFSVTNSRAKSFPFVSHRVSWGLK